MIQYRYLTPGRLEANMDEHEIAVIHPGKNAKNTQTVWVKYSPYLWKRSGSSGCGEKVTSPLLTA